jgi:ATP-dependent Clp protease adaptor protein ClpS
MREKPVSKRKEAGNTNDNTLVIFNDDYNTFDHVIKSLVEVCGHDSVQAEQCAVITHFKGNCEVKCGRRNILESMRKGLNDRKIESKVK